MIRDFNHAKNIVGYLEKRYGKIKRHTIRDDIEFVKDICDDHNLQQISMMRNRIQASIHSGRDTSYVNNNPVNFLTVLFTVVCSLMFGFITIGAQLVLAYIGHVVNISGKDITIKDLDKMVDSFNLSSLLQAALIPTLGIFIMIYAGILILNSALKKDSSKIHMYDVLIREAYERKRMETTIEE
ncbi:hypothetical protein [Cytobacillus oceanisediminis]|uniref:hypothetical protein n=1 Tax=Cytobacillus oceanisediminis TaxID=665099 RepID=UPI002079A70B|nr:hypothetical protein [Cytobacillus oceanisediminis]USK46335.1 hypothetical protein LIT27_10950 [Cytobacillus oceanisediminis]